MSRPSDAELRAFLDGEHAPAVEEWLAHDSDAPAVLDAIPLQGFAAEVARVSSVAGGPQQAVAVRSAPAPALIGRFPVIRELGRGGMGVVYLAEDTKLARRVAVKVIHKHRVMDPEFAARFVKEGRAMAKVADKSNVVAVHEAGEDGNQRYLVMEYLEGVTLETWLAVRPGPAPVSDVLWVAAEVLAGLNHIHTHGSVHRDIKPSNLWAQQKTGRVKILDFGVVTHSGADTGVVGTTEYMSPEQLSGGVIDERSDLYSLGRVLYRMVTDHPLLPGATPAVESLDHIPAALTAFICRLLAGEATARYSSASTALDELQAVRESVRRDEVEGREGAKLRAECERLRQAETDRRAAARQWVWLTVGLAASLGIVVAGWLLDRTGESRRAGARASLVGQLRDTDRDLDQAVVALDGAAAALDRARALEPDGPADPQTRVAAAAQIQTALLRHVTARDQVQEARGRRAALLDQLAALDGR